MFLGIYHVMNPNNSGALGPIFDQLMENCVYACKRAIQIYSNLQKEC